MVPAGAGSLTGSASPVNIINKGRCASTSTAFAIDS